MASLFDDQEFNNDDDNEEDSGGSRSTTRRDPRGSGKGDDEAAHAARLRAQMQRDALQTYEELGELQDPAISVKLGAKGKTKSDFAETTDTLHFTQEEVSTAREFLSLGVKWMRPFFPCLQFTDASQFYVGERALGTCSRVHARTLLLLFLVWNSVCGSRGDGCVVSRHRRRLPRVALNFV